MLGILAVLIGLLLPVVQRVRPAGWRARCTSNLRQLALVVHHFHDTERRLPYNQFLGPYHGGPDSTAWSESFRSRHAGGLYFAHADGSVHFIENGISLPVYRALATIRGGEVALVP